MDHPGGRYALLTSEKVEAPPHIRPEEPTDGYRFGLVSWVVPGLVRGFYFDVEPGSDPDSLSSIKNVWEKHWSQFFPGVSSYTELAYAPREDPDPFDPLIVGFDPEKTWHHYCEPLAEFRGLVYRFKELVRWCTRWDQDGGVGKDRTRWGFQVREIQNRVHWYLLGVHPVAYYPYPVAPEGEWIDNDGEPLANLSGRWEWRLVFPSLLAAAYWKWLDAFTGKCHPRRCANTKCGKTFIPDRPNQTYCSPECQNRQKQRTHYRKTTGKENEE
jgi:hypothetical protein